MSTPAKPTMVKCKRCICVQYVHGTVPTMACGHAQKTGTCHFSLGSASYQRNYKQHRRKNAIESRVGVGETEKGRKNESMQQGERERGGGWLYLPTTNDVCVRRASVCSLFSAYKQNGTNSLSHAVSGCRQHKEM